MIYKIKRKVVFKIVVLGVALASLMGCAKNDKTEKESKVTVKKTVQKNDDKLDKFGYLNLEENGEPDYYCIYDGDKNHHIENQGTGETCWAYAAVSALESTLLKEREYFFSQEHMIKKMTNKKDRMGNHMMSLAYYLSWKGPVNKKDKKVAKHVQEARIISEKKYADIKKCIREFGGVESSVYLEDGKKNKIKNYNKKNGSYAYLGHEEANHEIVIIGWDDDYPKENFDNKGIEDNGAFICVNSWGESFGKNGIFYVSYEDTNIGKVAVCYSKVEKISNYDNIYQADLLGWKGSIGFDGSDTTYMANIYTAKSREMLKAVGFYATTPDVKYEVSVVKDYEGLDSLANSKMIDVKGEVSCRGFYTVNLNVDYMLKEGEKYAVIVKMVNKNPLDMTKLVAVELDDGDIKKPILKDGEGYISADGKAWISSKDKNCNICLKAYSVNRD